MSVSYYAIYQDTQSGWRWRYVAKNGRVIGVSSEAYVTKQGAEHSVGLMQASGSDPVV
ncbi:MAG TPA: DUF1508 domain-containing protein [Allosphingosinicella sp.]|jgi:uncharacterized protein YegP (UPF0339 family)|nr:DUF1508 domain-containing protein [Allosphingosinicella sp.]